MNIGDKVRVIHGREEGVIVGFSPKGHVEVMLVDGFRIPFAKSDLVVVSVLEDKVFSPQTTQTSTTKETLSSKILFADKGIFLGKIQESDGVHSFSLINNTDYQLLFTSFLSRPNQDTKTLAAAVLNKKTSLQVFHTSQISMLEEGKLLFQILFFAQGRNETKLPLVKEVELKPKLWKREPEPLPILQKKGVMLQLDIALDKTHASALENAMEPKAINSLISTSKPPTEMDLHIEKLVNDHYSLKPDEMLRYQLRAFENHLEKSISAGLKEVTYIHGVGNGILKSELHKKLSSNIFVKHFEDARKDKYGYGATKVVLK